LPFRDELLYSERDVKVLNRGNRAQAKQYC